MLDCKDESPSPKCSFAATPLPTFVNHDRPPTTKKPFSTILHHPFCHILDVTLPRRSLDTLQTQLSNAQGTLKYAKVHMKLSDLIHGDFFNNYIKQGNLLMQSEGRAQIDQTFTLCDGILRLDLDKATYERLGLVGKPVRDGGCKHIKSRFEVELNLRLPSMVHGRKGFARIEWAFKHVLQASVTWLLYDLKAAVDGTGAIAGHQPLLRSIEPTTSVLEGVNTPNFSSEYGGFDAGDATELLEWLHLVRLDSPRVCTANSIDRYLSRYDVPKMRSNDDEAQQISTDLVTLQWRGLVPPTFATRVFLASLKAAGDGWFSMSASSFTGQSYTILKTGAQTLTWEYEDR